MTKRVLIAPDKFKGSLTAAEVADALASGLLAARPQLRCDLLPIADGGDGTVAAAVAAGFDHVPVRATGPLGAPVDTGYARKDEVALVELADVSGLHRMPAGVLDPANATSYGTGEVIAAALEAGARTIVLGVGGSAGVDGGAGMLQALGVRLLDVDGHELPSGAAPLAALSTVDTSTLHARLRDTRVVLASDVDNPLLGAHGAIAVFGAQKGVRPDTAAQYENNLARFAALLDPAAVDIAGAGAAGGVGYGAIAVLNAQVRSGAEYILDLVDFPAHLAACDVVITGEGRLDEQTTHGKGPAVVARIARGAGKPVVAVAGLSDLDPALATEAGFVAVRTLAELAASAQESVTHAAALLRTLATQLAPTL